MIGATLGSAAAVSVAVSLCPPSVLTAAAVATGMVVICGAGGALFLCGLGFGVKLLLNHRKLLTAGSDFEKSSQQPPCIKKRAATPLLVEEVEEEEPLLFQENRRQSLAEKLDSRVAAELSAREREVLQQAMAIQKARLSALLGDAELGELAAETLAIISALTTN